MRTIFVAILILVVIGWFAGQINDEDSSPVQTAKEAAEAAEKKRKGFHCLSAWDGSHRGVKRYTEERMRDPDSFEHIETRITPVNAAGEHALVMQYRARNGFGGMNVNVASATIRNSDCRATILSIE